MSLTRGRGEIPVGSLRRVTRPHEAPPDDALSTAVRFGGLPVPWEGGSWRCHRGWPRRPAGGPPFVELGLLPGGGIAGALLAREGFRKR